MFDLLLIHPLFNLMIFVYNVLPNHDIATTVIVVTLVIKIILLPLATKAHRGNIKMQSLQPKIDEIQKQYKDDKQKAGTEIMALYKREGVNHFTTCLVNIAQIIVLIAIYQVFIKLGSNPNLSDILYPFVYHPTSINTISYFDIDLSKPNIILAVLAGIAQFVQAKTAMVKLAKKTTTQPNEKEQFMKSFSQSMVYTMPIITIWIGSRFPGVLSLYWLISVGFSAIQQIVINKHLSKEVGATIVSSTNTPTA